MAEPQIDVPDKILELVERCSQDRERLRRQIEAGDREIDALVYELYGLTGEEIRLVEEKQG
jgi:hypothetical protein